MECSITLVMVRCAARDLSPPGELSQQVVLPFEFKNVEMEYESYRGTQVRLRSLPAPSRLPSAAEQKCPKSYYQSERTSPRELTPFLQNLQ